MKLSVLGIGLIFLSHSAIAGDYDAFTPEKQFETATPLAVTPENHLFLSPLEEWCSQAKGPSSVVMTADGKVDETFKSDGAVPSVGMKSPCKWTIRQIAPLKSGQYLQVTNAGSDGSNTSTAFVSRIDGKGNTDQKFGKNGFVIFEQGEYSKVLSVYEHSDETIYGINVQCEIIQSGIRQCSSYVFHLLNDGTFDSKFGKGGFVLRNVSKEAFLTNMSPVELRVEQGKIIVVERRHHFDYDIVLFAYQMDGTLEQGYHPRHGKLLRRVRIQSHDPCRADSRLTKNFVYTVSGCKSDSAAIVMRYELSGELDRNYGQEGKVILPITLITYQKIPFVELTDLNNGEIAISAGVSWPTDYSGSILTSAFTFHIDSSGQLGKWGKGEKILPGPYYWGDSDSVVDTQGRLILKLEKTWIRTKPMR